jgi:hypothetical protein
MRTICVFLLFGLISSSSLAASDVGVITEFYTDDTGNVAVKLAGGFPNSEAANECATFNGRAGISSTANPALKAALLASKSSQASVSLSIAGCALGGAWLRITAIYVQ